MDQTYHFNSRPHEEVDKTNTWSTQTRWYFNSRPHEEVDLFVCCELFVVRISTHDLTRRSTEQMYRAAWMLTFQLTTSRGGRQISSMLQAWMQEFQLTTSRGGRRPLPDQCQNSIISTHDLTRRSTISLSGKFVEAIAFQLTTSRGGRRLRPQFPITILYFNSRPHEEVDCA